MSSDKYFSSINVKMGDNNTVGHIGHKITFNAPPPNPNSIAQNGIVVGAIGSAPMQEGDLIVFQKLFVESEFNREKPFFLQGLQFLFLRSDAETQTSIGGRPPQITLWRAFCRSI